MRPNRRFVQFPHPGSEHRPDRLGQKPWNTIEYDHARKFIEIPGRWFDGQRVEEGTLWAWAEWEPESDLIGTLVAPSMHHPHNLWRPYWTPKADVVGLHNTDPFIYDGFYYTDCKQAESPSLEGLRRLDPGSIIAFGSAKRPQWVLDTVLVVSDYIDHDRDSYRQVLDGSVPVGYEDIVLRPTYQDAAKSARRLYRGATYEDRLDGMFSFFPACPANTIPGFPRPAIDLPPEHFTVGLLQGAKGHGLAAPALDSEVLRHLWDALVEQVLAQGLVLGIYAEMPMCRPDEADEGR